MLHRTALIACTLLGLACASPQPLPPIEAGAMRPGPNERIDVDQLVVIVDTSASISEGEHFASEQALVRSFAASLPDGRYEAGAIVFGGFERQSHPLEPFDRDRFGSQAAGIEVLNEGTQLDRVFAESSRWLSEMRGRAAVVVFSDGLPTDAIGRPSDGKPALDAAGALAGAYSGTVCFHSVQIGASNDGAEFLRRLSQVTPCGTFRAADAVRDVATLHGLQRDIFLGAGAGLPAVAAAPRDADGDGVYDVNDLCPATPRGTRVGRSGCWLVSSVTFRLNSAEIASDYRRELESVVELLGDKPGLRVRVDGHTDTTGPERFNVDLSRRRARAVGDYLVARGVDASRIESKGWGEKRPAFPNDTEANRSGNRRAEISVSR